MFRGGPNPGVGGRRNHSTLITLTTQPEVPAAMGIESQLPHTTVNLTLYWRDERGQYDGEMRSSPEDLVLGFGFPIDSRVQGNSPKLQSPRISGDFPKPCAHGVREITLQGCLAHTRTPTPLRP